MYENMNSNETSLIETPCIEMANESPLVDIRDVHTDRNRTKYERIAEFIRQIRNPYLFKCKRFQITAVFAEDGAPLEDCLLRLMG